MSKKTQAQGKDGVKKQNTKLGDIAQEQKNTDPSQQPYVQSLPTAFEVIEKVLDNAMEVCQDKELAKKLKPFSMFYTMEVLQMTFEQKSMKVDLRIDDNYIQEEDSEDPIPPGKDNISNELLMNQDPVKQQQYKDQRERAISVMSNKSKKNKSTPSRFNKGMNKLIVSKLRGSALEALDSDDKSVQSRSHRRRNSRESIASHAAGSVTGKGPTEPASAVQVKKKKLKQSDSQKALQNAKKMLEYYQTQVKPVVEWGPFHNREAMTDGTDVDQHIDRQRAIKGLLDDPDDDGNAEKQRKKLAALERRRQMANKSTENKANADGDGDAASMGEITDYGGYFIEDGKINTITKPKADRLPKGYNDSIKVAITDEIDNESIASVERELMNVTGGRSTAGQTMQLGLGGGLLGQLARAATNIKPDKEAIEREKQKPSYTKQQTVEFGGLKLAETDASKKLVSKMKAAEVEANVAEGRQSTDLSMSFTRRNAMKKGSQLSMKGVDVLENMDLQTNFDPRDGVNLYECKGGFEAGSKNKPRDSSGLKYQLLKKGKPYIKFGKDNKTMRMTRDKYFEVSENQDMRRMREDYDKLTQTMKESEMADQSNLQRRTTLNLKVQNVDNADAQGDVSSQISSRISDAANTFKKRHQSIDSVRAAVKGAKRLLLDEQRFRNHSLAFGDTSTTKNAFGKSHFGSLGFKYSVSPLNQESTLEFERTSRLATQRNSNSDFKNADQTSHTDRPWLPQLNTTGMSQMSNSKNRTQQQPFFFATKRVSETYGQKVDPKLVSQSRREKLNSMISTGAKDIDEHKMSRMLYGNPVATQKNLNTVKSLKQAFGHPSTLPTIDADKYGRQRQTALSIIADAGPIKAKKLASVLPLSTQNKSNVEGLRA